MKNFVRIFVASLLSILVINSTQAATPGFYIGTGAGYSKLDNFDDATSENGGFGGRLFVGYNVNKSFGIEAGYTRYASTRYTLDDYDFLPSFNYDLSAATLALKVYLPLNPHFDFYALLGVAEMYGKLSNDFLDGSESRNDPSAMAGIGINYIVTPNISLNLEYSNISGHSSNEENTIGIPSANLLTLGLAFHIG